MRHSIYRSNIGHIVATVHAGMNDRTFGATAGIGAWWTSGDDEVVKARMERRLHRLGYEWTRADYE